MDIRGWLYFVRDWFLLLVAGTVVSGVAAFALTGLIPKTYEGQATLLVGQSLSAANPDISQLLASQAIAQTFAEVATTQLFLERVIADLNLDTTPADLAQTVGARAPANSTLLIITAQANDPETAAAIANELSNILLTGDVISPGIEEPTEEDVALLDGEIAAIRDEIDALLLQPDLTPTEETRLQDLRDELSTKREERADVLTQLTGSANRLTIIEPAVPPTEPIAPRVLLSTAVGAFVGLVVSTIAAYAIESMLRPGAQADRQGPTMATPAAPQARARGR